MKKDRTTLYLWLTVVIMAVLFYSSAQTYQEQTSIPFLEKILKNQPLADWLSQFKLVYAGSEVSIAHSGYFKFIEFFIRKGAHFGIYFLLGLFWFKGLQPKLKSLFLAGGVSYLCAVGYAGLDEFHQSLTGGRTPLFQDVMLDGMGALTAILIVILGQLIFQNKKKKRA